MNADEGFVRYWYGDNLELRTHTSNLRRVNYFLHHPAEGRVSLYYDTIPEMWQATAAKLKERLCKRA